MQRHELLAQVRLWIGRMTEAQFEALAADLRESVPEVCDERYDTVVARVRVLPGGEEDAEEPVRVLRENGRLKAFLGRRRSEREKEAVMAKKTATHKEVAPVKALKKAAPTARTCKLVERLMASLEDLAEGLGEGYCPHLVADHIRDWFEEWMADYERRWVE